MNLTAKRFLESGIESDINALRNNVQIIQKDINRAGSLLKKIRKSDEHTLTKYVEESEMRSVYEDAKIKAATMNKKEFIQFIQTGGLLNAIGQTDIHNGHSPGDESGTSTTAAESSADNGAGDTPDSSIGEQSADGLSNT